MPKEHENMSPVGSHEEELEAIELEFLEALDNDQNPTLEDYIHRYPHLKREVTDFIINALKHRYRLAQIDQEASSQVVEAPSTVDWSNAGDAVVSLTDRMRYTGNTAKSLASIINVPVEIVVKLQRRQLREVPDRLVARLARVLRTSALRMQELVEARGPQLRTAGAFRAEGKPEAVVDLVTTFEQEMMSLRDKKKVTEEQAREWLG